MPDNALSSVPASQTEAPPTAHPSGADGAGAAATDGATALVEKIQRASTGAVDQYLSESPKRGRGKRGPDKNPGARPSRAKDSVPLEDLGNGSGEPFLAESAPAPLETWVEEPASFDEALAAEGVQTARELLSDCASAIVRAVAMHQTGDTALADQAAKDVTMAGKTAETFDRNGVRVAKKYNVPLTYLPEMALLACMVTWGKQVSGTVSVLNSKGAELRKRAKEGRAA